MTGFSFPEGLLACVNAWRTGGFEAARAAFLPYLPMVNFEQQARIALAVRKEALHRRALIADPAARPPAAPFPAPLSEPLDQHLAAVESAVPMLQGVG
jgi:4-hydroxy-tetrahydrodipicolinate synthase